ncbi:MAG: TetR family transcriptional regulator [Microbacteriaceae bacterium]|nr:TetR family transcriptional regulator [Microbacteriaceae bacterium]
MAASTPTTSRARAKAERRAALLGAAARLFAERGFERVTLEEIGGAAGISGPAVYRHFAGKQAVLAAILVDASRGLLEGGRRVVEGEPDAGAALRELVAFHVSFAVGNAAVIRVQDRDLDSLADPDRREVRTLQRTYVELWVGVLARLSGEPVAALRSRAHAAFGLMNSTPHSTAASPALLSRMALAALRA